MVFVPGAGTVGLAYLNVQEQAADLTTSVIYDRAGTGWSARVDLPRTAAEVADEIRALLRVAGVPASYLLVGHSLGGLYVRRFAQRFPDEVAGLLLLDPGHEDYPAYMLRRVFEMNQEMKAKGVLPEPSEAQLRRLRGLFEQMFAEWPDALRELLVDGHLDPEWQRIAEQERQSIDDLYDELRRGGDVPDVPMIVLTAMAPDPFQAALMPERE